MCLPLGGECRNDISAHIDERRLFVRRDDVDQSLGVEHVVAHAGEASGVVTRHSRWIVRFLVERLDKAALVGFYNTELVGFITVNRNCRNGDTCSRGDVLVDHLPWIHAVDVICSKHCDVVGSFVVDEVEVLVDRIG